MKLILRYLIIRGWNHTGWGEGCRRFLSQIFKMEAGWSRGWSQKKLVLWTFEKLELSWEEVVNEIKGEANLFFGLNVVVRSLV